MAWTFAALTTQDRPAILAHLLGLCIDDRILRFGRAASDESIVQYCSRWNFAHDIVEGAREDGRVIGVIHLPVYDERGDLAGDLGVSVEARSRQRHIATRIAARVLERGGNRGLARVYIHFLLRNRPMMCLASRFTTDIVVDHDEAQATIHLRECVPADLPPQAAGPSGRQFAAP